MRRASLLLLGLVSVACQGNDALKSQVVSESQTAAVTGSATGLLLGEDCTAGRASTCSTMLCLKMGQTRGQGYVCTKECQTEVDCPLGWLCQQLIPAPNPSLCVAPDNWAAHATAVRP